MAGANPNKSMKPSPSQPPNRRSRWESSGNSKSIAGKPPNSSDNARPPPSNNYPSSSSNPSPKPPPPQMVAPPPAPAGFFPPGPYNDGGPDPPPQPAYGFHMLDRRTIALADGSVRSYFALPHEYHHHHHPQDNNNNNRAGGGLMMSPEQQGFRRPNDLYWNNSDPPEAASSSIMLLKRKFGGGGGEERDEFARQRQQLLQYGNPNNGGGGETSNPFDDDVRASKHMRMMGGGGGNHNVDQQALKRSFLQFVKLIYENTAKKLRFLENGKQGPLDCLVCGRASKEFPDMHGLIMHVYGPHSGDLHVDHLGLHKALCVLMGWNYAKVPENSKAYQSLPANEAEANKEDLILWPPLVIIHNTNTGKSKDGRMDGLGNRVMDIKLKDLGFGGGKAKSLYGKEGHLGITLVKFAPDQSGLKEAVRLAEYFEKDYHGRKGWARAQQPGIDDETNPNLVNLDEMNREDRRILYGYLATVLDLEKVDFETKKRVSIESKRELKP